MQQKVTYWSFTSVDSCVYSENIELFEGLSAVLTTEFSSSRVFFHWWSSPFPFFHSSFIFLIVTVHLIFFS